MTIDKTLNDILNHFAEYAKYDPDQKRFNLLSDNYKFHQAGKVMEMLISEYDPSGVLAVMYAKREFLNSLKKRVDLGSLIFAMAGDEFEDTATDELNGNGAQAGGSTPHESYAVTPDSETEDEYTVEPTAPPQRELTFEEKVEQAMRVPCPITKYGGKTLGDVLQMDPKAIQWCATKFTGGEEIRNAAKLICEYAQQKASA